MRGPRHLVSLSLLLFAFPTLCFAQSEGRGTELDMSDLRPTFSQEFKQMPPLRAGGVNKSAPKPLDDPSFIWTAAYKFANPSPSGIPGRSATYREPAIAWHPGEGAVYPNADAIGASGWTPFSIRDGKLVITADHTPTAMLPFLPEGFSKDFVSGALITYPYSQRYGYFEARMKLAKGRGLWPAFWLVPADGRWPPENDIMEMLGHDPNSYYATVHTVIDGRHVFNGEKIATPDLSADFHLYGVDWGPEKVRYYFDRHLVHEAPTPADWHEPFYLLVNLGVGGPKTWPGAPDATTTLPAQIEVDYVKAWQKVYYESPTRNPKVQ
jgi:glycosyl hydrolase family 16